MSFKVKQFSAAFLLMRVHLVTGLYGCIGILVGIWGNGLYSFWSGRESIWEDVLLNRAAVYVPVCKGNGKWSWTHSLPLDCRLLLHATRMSALTLVVAPPPFHINREGLSYEKSTFFFCMSSLWFYYPLPLRYVGFMLLLCCPLAEMARSPCRRWRWSRRW